MKLQGVYDQKVYATSGREVFVSEHECTFESIGHLPLPQDRRASIIYHALTTNPWRALVVRFLGAVTTVNVWPISESTILATVGHSVFVSHDQGHQWQETHHLPSSSGPMGVLPSAVAHQDGVIYIGEYPLSNEATPRILASCDDGHSWSEYIALPEVRHIHAIQADPYTDELWVTTGDTDAECHIGRLRDGEFEIVGGGSQHWRAVQLAFTPTAILWGMDCGYADENLIFRLPREKIGVKTPAPEPVYRAPGSVYYSAEVLVDGHQWVVFSTAMEVGSDSTAQGSGMSSDSPGLVVAASSETEYTDWYQLLSFRRRRSLTEYLPGNFPRANGYIFLASVDDRGLFVNPFNSDRAAGTIQLIPPEQFTKIPHQQHAISSNIRQCSIVH